MEKLANNKFSKKVMIGNCPVCNSRHQFYIDFIGEKGKKTKKQSLWLTCPSKYIRFEWTIHEKKKVEQVLDVRSKGAA